MPKLISRKFVSPAFSGEMFSEGNGEFKEDSSRKKEKAMPRSLSDSQYEELFNRVIKKSVSKSKESYVKDDSSEEDNVAIPEPDAALSPDEEAEEMNRDIFNHGSATLTKTPKNPIDNSILPPLKKKKPESRIKLLGLKLKPTRLNFDDPELKGEDNGNPENVCKPLETDTLPKRKYKMPKITSNSGNTENKKLLPDKETSKANAIPSKSKGGNEDSFVKPFVSPKFQSQQTATGKGADQRKISPCDRIIPSSNLSSVSNFGSLSLSQSTPKSFQFGSQESCSPESKILSPKSRLFRLQKKRNVGLWVQCSNSVCSKWRYLPNTRDPTEVPEKWQCYMHDDERYASCSAPEHGPTPLEEEDLIHNIYTAGSLVWAHLAGYPWWPAMVDDDPDVEQYYWITEFCDIPTHYNVTFFDEKPVTRAWLSVGALTRYVNNEKRKDFMKMTANGIDYSRRIKVAMEQANEATKLPVDERLKKFSFLTRYKGPIGKKRQLPDSPEAKRKKSKRDKVREDSLGDSQASILRSLEVVNEVLSQISSDSESEGSDEDPQIDLNKSLEEVNEINEVLNILSDCESVGVDDDQLEEYLKSAQKKSSATESSKEKSLSKPKKKFTKPSVEKERDKHKEKKQKTHSSKDSEKRKHGMGHSSHSKLSKSDDKRSDGMGKKKAESKEKSKHRSHESKDKREKMHTFEDSRKEKSETGQSFSKKESQQSSKKSDSSKGEADRKHKESFKKGHEVQKETERKNSGSEKTKEKHVSKETMSEVFEKKEHSKKREMKEKNEHSNRTMAINKKDEGRKREKDSANHHRKKIKEMEKGKDERSEKAEGKTNSERKDTNSPDKGAKESPNPSSSAVHAAMKGSTKISSDLEHCKDEEKDSGKDRNINDSGQKKEKVVDEQQEKERPNEGTARKSKVLEEKVEEEKEIEEDNEEVMQNERMSEGEPSGFRVEEQMQGSSLATKLSDGRASADMFKEGNEEDAASVASEKSADFDFEE